MRIAILGASSQIARDLIVSLSVGQRYELVLFARNPESVNQWLRRVGLVERHAVADFSSFRSSCSFGAVLNFVGVGSPKLAHAMGASILDVTYEYDELALRHIRANPDCRYIFLGSGASLGLIYQQPADVTSNAIVPLGNLQIQDFYGVAKLYAECRHRAALALPIIDLRVFSYFSCTQNLDSGFFLSDIVSAILSTSTLQVTSSPMTRDFIGPEDFHQLIDCLLQAPPQNRVVDCYSRAPIEKQEVLKLMHDNFGLKFEIAPASTPDASQKSAYYSLSRTAAEFGYAPKLTSGQLLLQEVSKTIDRVRN